MDFEYLIPFFVKHMNQQVTYALNRRVNETYKKGNAHFYNDGFEKLANKKVLIASGSTGEKFEMSSFCKNFGLQEANVSIVDQVQIEEAIRTGDEKVAFVYDITSSGTIYDAKTTDALAYGTGQNMKGNNIYKWVMAGIGLGLFAAIVVSMKD